MTTREFAFLLLGAALLMGLDYAASTTPRWWRRLPRHLRELLTTIAECEAIILLALLACLVGVTLVRWCWRLVP